MPNVGPMELIVILAIALIVLGPKKLPEVGNSLGKGMREFKESLGGRERPRRRGRAPRHQEPSQRRDRYPRGVEIAPELIDRIVAHARRDFPNECCGMIAVRDGRAVSVHEAENLAASPLRFEVDGLEVHAHDRGDRGRGRRARRDLPLAHALGALPVADRRQLRRRLARRGVAHRRPAPDGDEPSCARYRIDDGRVTEVEVGAWLSRRSSARRAATPHPADERFCAECGMPLTYAGRRTLEQPVVRRATRARARSSRSTARATSCASPAPATRPRPSSSRACCSRRACRRCCAARAASTCPTCSPPARAT